MKLKTLLQTTLLLVLLASQPSIGISQMRTSVQIGFHGTNFSGESNSSFSPAFQLGGGIGLEFMLTNQLFIQPQIIYAVKGASGEGDIQFDAQADAVPVTARFSIGYFDRAALATGKHELRITHRQHLIIT